jgi:hypothetical protein
MVVKNGYDSLTQFCFFEGGEGDFVQCLNFVTNTMFQMSGLLPSSAKEARYLMDPLYQVILRHLLKYVREN